MKTKIMVDVQGAVELLSYDDEEKKWDIFTMMVKHVIL